MGIGTTRDQTTEETIVTKGMETEIRTIIGLEKGIEIGVVQESSQSRGGNQSNRDQSRNEDRRQS